MVAKRPTGLGRGLSALMADVPTDIEGDQSDVQSGFASLPIEIVYPNPEQPRQDFDQDDLLSLTASVREKGVLQPLVVRSKPDSDGEFQIVAGERRWRAAQMAGLHQIPVVIKEFTDIEVLEIAIVENIQRADLNPIEEAAGYQRLLDEFGHTQDELAKVIGKSRSHISNLLRLLNLPNDLSRLVRQGDISMGHARALLGATNPSDLGQRILNEGLSVRDVERIIKAEREPKSPAPKSQKTVKKKSADTKLLEDDLTAALGMQVSIDHHETGENGSVTIKYSDLDQLDQICGLLSQFNQ